MDICNARQRTNSDLSHSLLVEMGCSDSWVIETIQLQFLPQLAGGDELHRLHCYWRSPVLVSPSRSGGDGPRYEVQRGLFVPPCSLSFSGLLLQRARRVSLNLPQRPREPWQLTRSIWRGSSSTSSGNVDDLTPEDFTQLGFNVSAP
jgi:hypothetical protein